MQYLIREKYSAMSTVMGLYRDVDGLVRRVLRRPQPDGQIGIRVFPRD